MYMKVVLVKNYTAIIILMAYTHDIVIPYDAAHCNMNK